MSDQPSERRLIENELIVRNKNINSKEAIKHFFTPSNDNDDTLIDFRCECSDLSCKKVIKLTIQEYEKLHKRDDRFCVHKGHQTEKVEKIVQETKNYLVVEKEAVPA